MLRTRPNVRSAQCPQRASLRTLPSPLPNVRKSPKAVIRKVCISSATSTAQGHTERGRKSLGAGVTPGLLPCFELAPVALAEVLSPTAVTTRRRPGASPTL